MPIRNRGKNSNDDLIFSPKCRSILKEAADDACYLLSRGYAEASTIQLVGNRYQLNKRQRMAITRIIANDQQLEQRKKSEVPSAELKENQVLIDGFNLLILLESALSGAYIFKGRDGTYRDLSSVHGSYKRVKKTMSAIQMIGQKLIALDVKKVIWYLDQPVSNSGRLKTMLMKSAAENNYPWEVILDYNPDKVLSESKEIVITSDSWILDRVEQWYNLGANLVGAIKGVHVVEV